MRFFYKQNLDKNSFNVELKQIIFENNNGKKKGSFEVIKDKNGDIHKLKGISENNNPNIYNIEEHILKKKEGKFETQHRTFKIKSSDINNILKESFSITKPRKMNVLNLEMLI